MNNKYPLNEKEILCETNLIITGLLEDIKNTLEFNKVNEKIKKEILNLVEIKINFILNTAFQNDKQYDYVKENNKELPDNYIRTDYEQDKILQKINKLSKKNCQRISDYIMGIMVAEEERKKIIEYFNKKDKEE